MKIIMVGPLPPPTGGVSIHLKRMKRYLKDRNVSCIVYNESKWGDEKNGIFSVERFRKFIFFIPFIQGDIIHFHSADKRIRMMLGIYEMLGKKIILTIHGESLIDQIMNSNQMTRFLLVKSLKKIEKVICVNESNTNKLLSLGFRENQVVTLPAYINPIENEEDYLSIPEHVWGFMDGNKFVISANGCIRFYNNEDLYGVDLLIELVSRLIQNNMEVYMVFAVLDVSGQSQLESDYYKRLIRKVEEYQLTKHILFYEVSDTEFYPIVKKSSLFIRPTNTDGYGVSIAEAVHHNVPAIASDVCKRPKGTLLFQSRNIVDLYNKVVDVFLNYTQHKERITQIRIPDHAASLLELYQNIL